MQWKGEARPASRRWSCSPARHQHHPAHTDTLANTDMQISGSVLLARLGREYTIVISFKIMMVGPMTVVQMIKKKFILIVKKRKNITLYVNEKYFCPFFSLVSI